MPRDAVDEMQWVEIELDPGEVAIGQADAARGASRGIHFQQSMSVGFGSAGFIMRGQCLRPAHPDRLSRA
jgi:uncharacterized protein (AIM24 family)